MFLLSYDNKNNHKIMCRCSLVLKVRKLFMLMGYLCMRVCGCVNVSKGKRGLKRYGLGFKWKEYRGWV